MYYVYVIKSEKVDRIYIGSTSDLEKRLSYHNNGKVQSTKPYTPYSLIYKEEFNIKREALKREIQIKNMGNFVT